MKNPYPVVTTDAFILHTRESGEADRTITFLTKEAGIIDTHARSIRKEGAKLRGSACPYARVSLSAVLGKRTILKDITVTDTLNAIWNDREKYTAFVRLLRYVRSSVPVEEYRDEELFGIIETAANLFKTTDSTRAADVLLTARIMILHAFGYVDDDTVARNPFEKTLNTVSSSPARRSELVRQLETALYHQ